MRVLVATDGSLDVDKAATFASALAGAEGTITVVTIIHVPRTMLADLRRELGEKPTPTIDADAEYVGTPRGEGMPARNWPGDDAVIGLYLGNKRDEYCAPIVEALRDAGIDAEATVREGDDVAASIIEVATESSADVVVVGSLGKGAFQGLLGSVGSKLVRRAPCPVLVIR